MPIAQPPSYPIRVTELFYREDTAAYRVPPHTQKPGQMQWYCVIHGIVEQTVDGQAFVLHPTESVLIPAGAVRSPRAKAKAVGYIVANFDKLRLNLDAITRRILLCPETLRSSLQALVAELREKDRRSPENLELALLLVPLIFIGLRRTAKFREVQQRPSAALDVHGHQSMVAVVENYMRQNLQYSLTRADVADVVHLSESHLSRIFRAATGKSVLQRLTELRLAQASALLRESSLPITRIALEVGFNSFSHFTSLFKKSLGVSPSAYRRSGGHIWRAND